MDNSLIIADDDEVSRRLLAEVFRNQYDIVEAVNGKECLAWLEYEGNRVSAILLDIVMPEMDGLAVLEELQRRNLTKVLPVFCITGHRNQQVVRRVYELGAIDFLTKPIFTDVIARRVSTVVELFDMRKKLGRLVAVQQQQIVQQEDTFKNLNRDMVEALLTAIEFRSSESGDHVHRISAITRLFLETSLGKGMTQNQIEQISTGAIMHDVGKLSIPDTILNKPDRLTPSEFIIMKQHTTLGAMLLKKIPRMHALPFYGYAYDIALCHHERWNGQGYPRGIKGSEIPLWAQIVSIADVFDALVSPRVYKRTRTLEEAANLILDGECGVFNPALLEAFKRIRPGLGELYSEHPPETEDLTLLKASITGV